MEDIFNLQRFLDAQIHDYECALQEIKNGRKHVFHVKIGERRKDGLDGSIETRAPWWSCQSK